MTVSAAATSDASTSDADTSDATVDSAAERRPLKKRPSPPSSDRNDDDDDSHTPRKISKLQIDEEDCEVCTQSLAAKVKADDDPSSSSSSSSTPSPSRMVTMPLFHSPNSPPPELSSSSAQSQPPPPSSTRSETCVFVKPLPPRNTVVNDDAPACKIWWIGRERFLEVEKFRNRLTVFIGMYERDVKNKDEIVSAVGEKKRVRLTAC